MPKSRKGKRDLKKNKKKKNESHERLVMNGAPSGGRLSVKEAMFSTYTPLSLKT